MPSALAVADATDARSRADSRGTALATPDNVWIVRHGWTLLTVGLAAAACGGPSRARIAPAPAEAQQPAPIVVTVSRRGHPVPGAHVVYGDDSGAAAFVDRTGADGRTSRRVAPGSMVTVIDASAPTEITTRYTIVGVEPGDQLRVDREREHEAVVGTAVVALPGAFDGAAHYDVDIGCQRFVADRADEPVRIHFGARCVNSRGAITVRATALSPDHEPLAHAVRRDVSARGEREVPVALAEWSDTWEPFELVLVGAPPGATGVALQCSQTVGALEFDLPMQLARLDGRPVRFSFRTVPNLGASLRLIAMVGYGPTSAPDGVAFYVERVAAGARARTVDLRDALLPRIADVALSPIRTARPEVTWVASGDLSKTDGGVLRVAWRAGTSRHEWWIVLPPTARSPLRFPELPDELAAFGPGPTARFEPPRLLFLESDAVDGYRAMRNRATAGIFSNEEALGGMRRLRITFGGGGLLP